MVAAARCKSYSELSDLSAPDGLCTPKESQVAFFGAADSRIYIFLLSVTLLSTHRFHPTAGFFILMPKREADEIRQVPQHPFNSWSKGVIRTLDLPQSSANQFGSGGGYSRYTFHRHAGPEMLASMGFTWSVNLDPDVIALRPWDFRVLLQVKLIAGRPVGRGRRTARWLQERLDGQAKVSKGRSSRDGSEQSLEKFLLDTLNTTVFALERTPEVRYGTAALTERFATIGER